jgi:hypothetical protein
LNPAVDRGFFVIMQTDFHPTTCMLRH